MIPEELTKLPQWVNVYANSKVPMQSTVNKSASCSDPTTWSAYEDAINYNFGYSGIGFVLNDNHIVIIDIDDCVTNGVPNSFAMNIILKLGSYTEISRSGTGIHIVCYGDIPFKGKNNHTKGIEIYKDARYIILTGNSFLFNSLLEPQEEIDNIISEYFTETQIKANSGSNKGNVIYKPCYNMKHNKLHIDLTVNYPEITDGGRNHCLTSYAGQLRCMGYSADEVFEEVMKCNQIACKPPLDEFEVSLIVRSIMRYL